MSELINRRYSLEELLGKGGVGAVYRAIDRLATSEGQGTVALKRVLIPTEKLSFASQPFDNTQNHVALAREFQTLATIRHPNIISVMDYGFEQINGALRPYYTMGLLSNAVTITKYATDKPLEQKYHLIGQVLQALHYLHRRGVLHRDLKPDNILVEGNQVYVMDFGLAATMTQAEQERTPVGTLAYMAPELLRGRAATVASDLYDVGLVFFEMLTGNFPYQRSNAQELLNNIVYFTPDTNDLDVSPQVAFVLQRLISKDPEDRYQTALETLEALEEATGLQLVAQSEGIREAFLQASRMVGRDKEMEQLDNTLRETLTGHGSAWLVGGESGIGKSRLLAELRTLALVKGASVVRGAAVSEGGAPFQVWRNLVQWLALAPNLEESELAALRTIVPNLEGNQAATTASTPNTLFETLKHLIVQATQTAPLVLLLEDLHWATQESLDLLQQVSDLTADHALLVIGSYRHDETPHLAEIFQNINLLLLKRLSVRYISELTQQILGPAGELPIVNALLFRETEGNVFFLVETMRTLAEQVGDLGMIGIKTLPEQLFAGGIHEAIDRRLDRVPEESRALLYLMALVGREIDLSVLKALAPELNVENWLLQAADAAVLEPLDGAWTFSHDKLREGAVRRIDESERPTAHRRIALILEALYVDTPTYAAALAFHFGKAEVVEKERDYSETAGRYARTTYAIADAVKHLQRALDLTINPVKRTDLLVLLGECYEIISDYDRAVAVLTEAKTLARKEKLPRQETQALLTLADIARHKGEKERTTELLQQALALTESKHADLYASTLVGLGNLAAEEWRNDDALNYYEKALASDGLTSAHRLRTLISKGLTHNDMMHYEQAIATLSEGLDLAHSLGDTREAGRAANNMAGAYLFRGEYDNALACLAYRLRIALGIPDMAGIARSVGNIGFTQLRARQFDNVERCTQLAIKLSQMLGLRTLEAGYILNLGLFYMENYLIAEALSRIEEANLIVQETGVTQMTLQTTLLDAYLSSMMGLKEPEEAISEIENLVVQYPDMPELRPTADYWIWKIDNSRENARDHAASTLLAQLAQQYDAEAAERYTELTGNPAPAAPKLPAPPDWLLAEGTKVAELIAQAEQFLREQEALGG